MNSYCTFQMIAFKNTFNIHLMSSFKIDFISKACAYQTNNFVEIFTINVSLS